MSAAAAVAAVQPSAEAQALIKALNAKGLQLQETRNTQETLETQLNENAMVKEELDVVKDGESVYKLAGGVLVRQDLADARTTVTARIDFIQKELAKQLNVHKKYSAEMDELRVKLRAEQQRQYASASKSEA